MTRPPRLLSGPIEARDLPGLRFELLKRLIVDLGQRINPLHEWAANEGHTGWLRFVEPDMTTVIEAPKGFTTDFSSLPTGAEIIMGDRRKYRVAGVLHDLLYRHGAPRRPADDVWWRVARAGTEHVGPVRAWLGWAALRAFGWAAWRRWERVREAG